MAGHCCAKNQRSKDTDAQGWRKYRNAEAIVGTVGYNEQQYAGVQSKMTDEQSYIALICLSCGFNKDDIRNQSEMLKERFVDYLESKQAAGICNVAIRRVGSSFGLVRTQKCALDGVIFKHAVAVCYSVLHTGVHAVPNVHPNAGALPGQHPSPNSIVHVFPPCEFATTFLQRNSPDLFETIRQQRANYLFVVITSAS
ncbi:unnamed protein product [Toxocara canis]|uniref:SPOC domain-containing protein n=1 Tax=Toxocara canis TaxID=6265 RepID=A0A183UCJ4_TOXCA|nr:unnamed protein product [Toxocara canis]